MLTDCVSNYLKYDVWCENPVIDEKSFDLMQEVMIHAEELDEKVNFENIINTQLSEEIICDKKAT